MASCSLTPHLARAIAAVSFVGVLCEMTPKERAEQLVRLFEEGGEQALHEFATTKPIECLKAVESIYIIDEDFDGLDEFQAEVSEACRHGVEEQLTEDGFARFDEIVRLAREIGDDEAADKIESYLEWLRH